MRIAQVAPLHETVPPFGYGGTERIVSYLTEELVQLGHDVTLFAARGSEIWGDGKQTRSFTFISDCLVGIQKITWSDVVDPLNLGSSELVTINGLFDIVEDIAGIKLKRTYNLSAPKGVNGRNSDNTLIKKLMNWEPSTRLRDGMEKTYEWIYNEMVKNR